MSLLARLAHVKYVESGQGVSYGLTHHTTEPGWLAVLPLGYGDGIPRHASGVGPVLVGGSPAADRRSGLHGPGRARPGGGAGAPR